MSSNKVFSSLFLFMVFMLSACAAQPKSVDNSALNLDGLIAQMAEHGATVQLGDQVSQPFFSPRAQILSINGADVQVFEFPDVAAREAAQATISPDGTSIGTSMVTWMDTPHFWGKGQLIVLYVGSDVAMIDLIGSILR